MCSSASEAVGSDDKPGPTSRQTGPSRAAHATCHTTAATDGAAHDACPAACIDEVSADAPDGLADKGGHHSPPGLRGSGSKWGPGPSDNDSERLGAREAKIEPAAIPGGQPTSGAPSSWRVGALMRAALSPPRWPRCQRTHTHRHPPTRKHTHAHTHARARAHTHTHRHTHAHTHTHTRPPAYGLLYGLRRRKR
jgi:hypothetical protein